MSKRTPKEYNVSAMQVNPVDPRFVDLEGRPSKTKAKHKRRRRTIVYEGPKANYTVEKGRAVIELYMVHQLGYSPIRHIVGDKNEKYVEDIIRQHKLGRNNIDANSGELRCISNKQIAEDSVPRIKAFMKEFGTEDDPYNREMIIEGTWYSDNDKPAADSHVCQNCGHNVKETDKFCSECGAKILSRKQRKLYELD